jgi:membrane protease YdiL (CAAX protease family)
MKKPIRNILIFGAVTFACGWTGYAINTLYHPSDPMQSLGVLVWLVSPLAANLLLRWLGKDGWKDFGLRLQLRSSWRWYLVALLLFPAIVLAAILTGRLLGAVALSNFTPRGMETFLTLFIGAFAANAVKNIFEEFSWRGYLTPMLERIKAAPLLSALVTGFIWAGWHIPYYLYFLDPAVLGEQTTFRAPALILLSSSCCRCRPWPTASYAW